jgi:hypothetical protein
VTERRNPGRPRRLPSCACLVIWGAATISLAEATVWYHDWLLDYLEGPDGSYIGAQSMADRLKGKVSKRTVEQARVRLGNLGLYHTFRRAGCREFGRVCTLPTQCEPKNNKDAPAKALLLDQHVRSIEGTPTTVPRLLPDRTENTPTVVPDSASSTRVEGGKGGVVPLTLSSLSERQLSPAVVVKEVREIAHATEEVKRRPGEATGAWLERLSASRG